MTVKILGSGCPNCEKLFDLARQAAIELDMAINFEKVKDLNKIVEYGVYRTPGLVINEIVKSSGRIPTVQEIKKWYQEVTQAD
ncbi:TM0996/MTH895 family glutaredoxin-like protein [candidate division KSB1 bacterium]|nr:TM0996/MTH895 family glutaredoxin-like protein [candidate division KSB1 bacterium]